METILTFAVVFGTIGGLIWGREYIREQADKARASRNSSAGDDSDDK